MVVEIQEEDIEMEDIPRHGYGEQKKGKIKNYSAIQS